jgi:hypothetical protein
MRSIFLLAALTPLAVAAQPVVEDTADLYARWRDRIVQVQVIDRQSQSRAGLGSGYFAGQPGWVITNYHVIADLANQAERYEARYLSETGRVGRLELLSVDVIHDLAVLRAEGLAPPPLRMAEQGPRKGTRLYSMGYPYDIGLTIVEGTYNGMMEKSLYDKLHFTGSINPGMSGGPALNSRGDVVGTNVSTAGNQVSFLVPAGFVAGLLSRTSEPQAVTELLDEAITRQLAENQAAIAGRLLKDDVAQTRLNGYLVPGALAIDINCWGNRSEEQLDELDHIYYRCQTQDDIYLSDTLTTGIIRYQHDLLSTTRLHPVRFYRQIEERGYYPPLRLDGDELSVTNYRCRSAFVDQSGMTFRTTFCVRAYRKFAGLYDAYLSLTSLVEDQEALQSTLVLAGFDWENISGLSARFIESMGWEERTP